MPNIFETPLLLGDTGGKPGVFTSFLLDLGSPVVGECTFFTVPLYYARAERGFGGSWFATSFGRLGAS